jgi:SPP1 family predicted phage head-tail adaptor
MDYSVNPGDLRTRITFQQPTIVTDAGGAQSETYANVTTNPTVWAKWVNMHGQEAVNASAQTSVQRATVTVRYRSDIQTTWRVVWNSTEYWRIISIDHVQRKNRWTELVIERVKGTV